MHVPKPYLVVYIIILFALWRMVASPARIYAADICLDPAVDERMAVCANKRSFLY